MADIDNANWNYPTAIAFGNGRINELPGICKKINILKPLIVTDEGLCDFSFIKKISDVLDQATIFSKVKSNPNGENINEGVTAFNQGKHDGVIAVGGGSALDAAKCIALMVGQTRSLWDFEDVADNYLRVNVHAMAPVVAIPTTAGTGSEVGRASVIVDESTKSKKIIFHPNMLPEYVILDPELSMNLPSHITAATGIDAFIHSFEAYCAPGYHPMADGIALQGMALIKKWLPVAFNDGKNLEARAHMLAASSMGATAFQKGLGAVHALAHPLGAIYDKHHGLLNGILLPYVMLANKTAIEERIKPVCSMLNLKESFTCLFDWVISFRSQLSIPNDLAKIGLDTSRAQEIAKLAYLDAASAGNPVKLSVKQYQQIFEAAVKGQL